MWSLIVGPVADLLNNILKRTLKEKASETDILNIQKEVKLALIDAERDVGSEDAKTIESINATMRAEAQSEHWMQWSWRPTIGFSFAAILVNNYILLPYLSKVGVVPIPVPDNVWTAMLVILGAAAAGRSFEKWQTTNGKNGH